MGLPHGLRREFGVHCGLVRSIRTLGTHVALVKAKFRKPVEMFLKPLTQFNPCTTEDPHTLPRGAPEHGQGWPQSSDYRHIKSSADSRGSKNAK